ncbi:MAG TPA: protein kinase [Kofleriaceae bacterium]|nr:protein kinase [Kofleriaceae bacterium]
MTCPHCHAPLTADARFCPACGKATSPTESGTSWPAAGSAPDLVGREIAGRYRIVKKLGEGGMGAVYRGEQLSLKRAVAVKVLKPELGANQMILRRFNAEAEAVAKLSHPNTVNIYDFGQDSDGSLFIAMEFIEGRSLREAIQKEGPFSPTRSIAIALQVAASLSDAHAHSIVHRDLKPDNVMLQDRGRNKDVVRVLDFGIAKLRDDNRATQQAMTQAGDMLGTPQYMAPEQIRGEAIDGRTDIYALGCMIYEMVTARLPYEAPTIMAMLSKHLLETPVPPSQRRPDLAIPASIDQLVLGAMAKDPNARAATMEQFAEHLQSLLATLPADPNRSAGMSVQQGAATPFAPPTQPPPAYTPAGFAPPTTPPPSGGASYAAPTPPPAGVAYAPPSASAPTAASGKSRTPMWIALGVLALGGAGAGIFFATRDSGTTAKADSEEPDEHENTPDKDEPDEHEQPDEPAQPDKWETPANNGEDPWAPKAQGGRAPKNKVTAAKPAAANPRAIGTDATPIPDGAKVRVGSGYTSQVSSAAHVHVNAAKGILIAMAPLLPGTNDPQKLGEMWTSQTGVTATGSMKIMSAGKLRPALGFAGEVNGVPVNQVVVLYIEPDYRVGVLYQAPTASFSDSAFQRDVMTWFARNVVLP